MKEVSLDYVWFLVFKKVFKKAKTKTREAMGILHWNGPTRFDAYISTKGTLRATLKSTLKSHAKEHTCHITTAIADDEGHEGAGHEWHE